MDSTLADHGRIKFPGAELIAASGDRNWSSVYAECRRHPAGELPAFTSSVTEVTYAIRGAPQAKVFRASAGRSQATAVRPGTLWICPQGVYESSIRMTGALPEILHICLPASVFQRLSVDDGMPEVRPEALRYEADPHDPLLTQLAIAIGVELKAETSAGRLLVEGASLGLAARLAHSYGSGDTGSGGGKRRPSHGLDPRRLQRVLDFIEENFDTDLSIADLARVACLSQFHFSRAFRIATGLPPHRYLSERRLQHAKALLCSPQQSISAIALACQFSSQASFTRAFTRAVGVPPAKFRQSA